MQLKLLSVLCCPVCENELKCQTDKCGNHEIITGFLLCEKCIKRYPIINSIPRFVKMENYAVSFGFQWNRFKHTQIDTFSKNRESEKRLFSETRWSEFTMQGNWILEVGCGNGRFLDICSRATCQVVGVDMSSAIEAAHDLFHNQTNVHLIQASIYSLPFKKESFDKCYCIGVIQHTPDPEKSIQTLPKFIKTNGQIALTLYEKKIYTFLYSKYLVRPITKRLNKNLLLGMLKILAPVLFAMTEVLFRLPYINRIFKFIIPYANYVHMQDLNFKQRYEWAILDTFDMLSPAHDTPLSESTVRALLEQAMIKNIKRLPNPGLNVVGVKYENCVKPVFTVPQA